MRFERTLTKTLLTLMLLALCAGLLPPAAKAAESGADAAFCVAAVEGTVTVKTASGRTMPVTENMPLRGGWIVETAPASYTTLNMDGVPAISLGADTKIELRQNPGKKLMELYVSKGVVVFDLVDALAEDVSFLLHTPTALSNIRGTMGEVKVVSPMCTQMYLLAGRTEVANSVQLFAAPTEEDAAEASETPAEASVEARGEAVSDRLAARATAVYATILTVRSGDGRTTVFVENTNREVVVNGVTVPSGSKAEVPQSGAAPKVTPMTPADRQELGASLAARSGAPSSGNGQGAVPAAPMGIPGPPAGLQEDDNMLADDTSPLNQSILQAQQLNKVLTPELMSSAALEFLMSRYGVLYNTAQRYRADGGEEAVARYLETLPAEHAAGVREIEKRMAAQAAAEAEAANKAFQTSQAAKAAEENRKAGLGGSGTVNAWGGNSVQTTDDDDDDDWYEPTPVIERGGDIATEDLDMPPEKRGEQGESTPTGESGDDTMPIEPIGMTAPNLYARS